MKSINMKVGGRIIIEAARGKCQIRAWTDFNQLALFLEAIGVEYYEVHNKAINKAGMVSG